MFRKSTDDEASQESYSPDDNRELPKPILGLPYLSAGFDLRPFLYPSRFPFQFRKIDELAVTSIDHSKSADKGDDATVD